MFIYVVFVQNGFVNAGGKRISLRSEVETPNRCLIAEQGTRESVECI